MAGHRTQLSHIPLLSCSMLPFPSVIDNTFMQFYLQLWSSWLWESRWSWPSSPGLKSWGAGQRNTGIFSSSHKSPLCKCVAPLSWAWCSCGESTVPEASETNQAKRSIKPLREGSKNQENQLMKRYGQLLAVHSHLSDNSKVCFHRTKLAFQGAQFGPLIWSNHLYWCEYKAPSLKGRHFLKIS